MEAVRRLVILVAALGLGACTRFDSRWQAAKSAAPADRYSGAWDGTWTSGRHVGHGDSLRCILTPAAAKSATAYEAEFKAVWMGVFSSTHKVTLQVAPGSPRGERAFSGSAKLSTLVGGGDYRCEGTISPVSIKANYDARYDTGTFQLRRVTAAPPAQSAAR